MKVEAVVTLGHSLPISRYKCVPFLRCLQKPRGSVERKSPYIGVGTPSVCRLASVPWSQAFCKRESFFVPSALLVWPLQKIAGTKLKQSRLHALSKEKRKRRKKLDDWASFLGEWETNYIQWDLPKEFHVLWLTPCAIWVHEDL